MTKELKRGPNFTSEDKNLLLSIIYNHKNTIENKKTDAITNHEKTEVWKIISSKFNSWSLHPRDATSLRKYYEKIKAQARNNYAEETKEPYLTGGGPPPKQKDGSDELILSLINKKSLEGLACEFGGDSSNAPILRSSLNNQNDNSLRQHNDVYVEFMDDDNESITHSPPTAKSDRSPILDKENSLSWKKYKPLDLKSVNTLKTLTSDVEGSTKSPSKPKELLSPVTHNIGEVTTNSRKRRRANLVNCLSNSVLTEKYNILLEKRLAIADSQKALISQDLRQGKIEHDLRVQKLKLEIEVLRSQCHTSINATAVVDIPTAIEVSNSTPAVGTSKMVVQQQPRW